MKSTEYHFASDWPATKIQGPRGQNETQLTKAIYEAKSLTNALDSYHTLTFMFFTKKGMEWESFPDSLDLKKTQKTLRKKPDFLGLFFFRLIYFLYF